MNDYSVARRRMVREQLEERGITDRLVLEAMRQVPRHRFVPPPLVHRAYQPCALPIGYGQTISQPFIVGLMTALLQPRARMRVLEVGTGSGYQSAVLARLVREVVSVERVEPLARRAAEVLRDLACPNVTVLAADGSHGVADAGPYDAILVTACAPALCESLLGQLVDGGFLLVPIDVESRQTLYRYQRRGTEVVVEQSLQCHFVPLVPGTVTTGEREADA